MIATGGNYRVWGPPESFIEGNNELALALVMTIPLMRFLQMQFKSLLVKHVFTVAMLLTTIGRAGDALARCAARDHGHGRSCSGREPGQADHRRAAGRSSARA